MIRNNGSPFVFGELKGTNWYRRFAAEEYYIMLDQYPEREIIEDKELYGRIREDDSRLLLYKEKIMDFFLHSGAGIDERSPWDILLTLREMKRDLFGDIDFSSQQGIGFSSAEGTATRVSGSWLEEVTADLLLKNRSNRIWIQQGLREQFEKSERILFIPGDPRYLGSELTSWLRPSIGQKEIEILCFDDPLYRGVTKGFASAVLKSLRIDSIRLKSFDPDQTTIEYLRDFTGSRGLVFTTGIWAFLTICKDVPSIVFALDNTQWCSRALFQSSYDHSERTCQLLKAGKYKGLLTETDYTKGISIAGFLEVPFRKEISISGVQYSATNIIDHIEGRSPQSFSERTQENRQWLSACERYEGVESISSFFRIEEGEPTVCGMGDKDAVHISSVMLDEDRGEVAPLFFDSMVDVEEIPLDGAGFLSCFNYYYTSNLVKVYNKHVRPEQQLNIENFFIDYLGFFAEKGSFESLPLYNKAFLGCTRDGSLFSGHYTMKGVVMRLGHRTLHFTEREINSANLTGSDILYLPGYEEEVVGEGRYCLVVIQDQIIFQGLGPCRIPPVGAVIVLEEAVPVVSETVDFSIEFHDLPVEKEDIRWMVGGFNLLVEEGVNCYETYEKGLESLEHEGWLMPQSKQTQETQLDPGKRQPRCVFGKTSDSRLILAVFSGRTALSCGATFSESVMYANSFLRAGEELDFLINFDGGASASLIAYNDGTFRNLGLTAPSVGNPAGVPRRLNAYFSISLKR